MSGSDISAEARAKLVAEITGAELVTIPGVAIPFPYGGKIRLISVDLDIQALQARGLDVHRRPRGVQVVREARGAAHHVLGAHQRGHHPRRLLVEKSAVLDRRDAGANRRDDFFVVRRVERDGEHMHALVHALSNVMPCFCRRVRPGMLRSLHPRGKCWTARC